MNNTLLAPASLLTALLLSASASTAQSRISRAERDSLMDLAESYRYHERYDNAIHIYERLGGESARLELASTYLEKGKVLIALEQAKAMKKDPLFSRKDDAMLIEAQCRQAQGFDRAANRLYRKLHKKGHAKGIYFYAYRLYAKGHAQRAEALCQEAIRRDRSIAPAHRLLAAIEISLGHRYRALLPLYYYMLTCSDEGREEALPQLTTIWRKEASFVYTLQQKKADDPFNDGMDKLMSQLVEQNDFRPSDKDEAAKIASMSDSLFAHAEQYGKENMDFWQVTYADFFAILRNNGFTHAMVNFFFAPADKGAALSWTIENKKLFDDFQLWLATQLGNAQ